LFPIECNELIFLRKNLLHPEKFRRSRRQMRIAFDFKGESCSGNLSLSGTIGIDRAISCIHFRNAPTEW
jgi:hypothetical protein